ncbi:hypothetical protein NEMBOFW57_008957 [Staphylotrichum longicolle]|uniref:Uncharacterized protein n=1 Tax=Staphylotrichum longicolle TaxID=669026 RepID=A0AAD4ES49_9PEZI|nr:hypothetical protein NEMBOFW57_008957 [Staphylotrichum longicolle]
MARCNFLVSISHRGIERTPRIPIYVRSPVEQQLHHGLVAEPGSSCKGRFRERVARRAWRSVDTGPSIEKQLHHMLMSHLRSGPESSPCVAGRTVEVHALFDEKPYDFEIPCLGCNPEWRTNVPRPMVGVSALLEE